jgi:hypothetical protein
LLNKDYNGESLEKLGRYTISEKAILLRVQIVEEQLEYQRKVARQVLIFRTGPSCLVVDKAEAKERQS